MAGAPPVALLRMLERPDFCYQVDRVAPGGSRR